MPTTYAQLERQVRQAQQHNAALIRERDRQGTRIEELERELLGKQPQQEATPQPSALTPTSGPQPYPQNDILGRPIKSRDVVVYHIYKNQIGIGVVDYTTPKRVRVFAADRMGKPTNKYSGLFHPNEVYVLRGNP